MCSNVSRDPLKNRNKYIYVHMHIYMYSISYIIIDCPNHTKIRVRYKLDHALHMYAFTT